MEPPELALNLGQCSIVGTAKSCRGSVDFVASERERMVAGELYDAGDPELTASRLRARQLTGRYNATAPDDAAGRTAILTELLAEGGEDAWIEPPFFCDYGWNISLGPRVFMNFNCVVLDVAPVRVGELTMFGPAVQLCAATHPLDPRERERGLEYGQPIEIGRNAWVGAGVVVGAGVTIGDDSVIGAGSVVVRDIPAAVLAAGSPCRVIRELTG
jgi:maltose O-acetyltransferase